MIRACTFGRLATTFLIRDSGIRLNAVESASTSVAVGATTLTQRYSEGLRPVDGSNRCVNRPPESNRNPAPADVETKRCLATQIAEVEARLQDVPRSRARELREEATRMSIQAAGLVSFPAALEKSDAESIAEALTDGYLEAAERSDDPGRLGSLQWLAERAIARLAWLRSLARPANTYPD